MWSDIRNHHLRKLREALEKGLVDEGVIPILHAINKYESYVTRSSCYGRIHLTLEKGMIRKGYGKTLLKRHGPVAWSEVEQIVRRVDGGVVWLNVEGTIIHVAAKTLSDALKMYRAALNAGYRESSIYSISTRGVTVEILLMEKYSIPLNIHGKLLYTDEEMDKLFRDASKIFPLIEEAKERFLKELGGASHDTNQIG